MKSMNIHTTETARLAKLWRSSRVVARQCKGAEGKVYGINAISECVGIVWCGKMSKASGVTV